MKSVKKSPAKKVVAKAAPVQKLAVKAAPKAVSKPVAAAKPAASKKTEFSPEQRYKLIEEAAYFIAERHGFNGDSAYFWSLAEAEISTRLK